MGFFLCYNKLMTESQKTIIWFLLCFLYGLIVVALIKYLFMS